MDKNGKEQTKKDRNKHKQNRINKNKQKQIETNRNGQKQTVMDRKRELYQASLDHVKVCQTPFFLTEMFILFVFYLL